MNSGSTISYYEYLFEISDGQEPTKLMYGWSKWGGASKGMVQEKTDTWYCQSCNKDYPSTTKSYMFPLFDREFGRICQECLDGAILNRIKNLWDLMSVNKKDYGPFG